MAPKIHIAFRFHGNFYHSYRGDTADELGFGKDIRIIRHILNVLDDFNQQDIPVMGTWDFENYFSLETIMPQHCPDVIEALKRRVSQGLDEIQFMSYNNGLINAHTAVEFEAAMRKAITNQAGSGFQDLFGGKYQNMVRPQEMMYTPVHLKLYKALGIDSISLYYSAIPFNGFSNFIPRLSANEQYNPLTLTYPGIEETMTLLPAYNVGDLADHITLRRWVKLMRRQQLSMNEPCDFLLLLDQDADDQFWFGFDAPAWIKKRFKSIQGLAGLINNVLDLDYVQFTTPGRYLKEHKPVKTISFGQDTADGSYDGLASWVEKWSNHRLFTGLERARILDLQTRRLAENAITTSIKDLLEESFETRLRILSTTHFGMAAPVMNLTRERGARDLVGQAVDQAALAFELAKPSVTQGTFHLLDYVRGVSTDRIQYKTHPSRSLTCLLLKQEMPNDIQVKTDSGITIPCAVVDGLFGRQLMFTDQFLAGEEKKYIIEPGEWTTISTETSIKVSSEEMRNESVQIIFDGHGQVNSCIIDGLKVNDGCFFTSGVTYGGRTYNVNRWENVGNYSNRVVGITRMRGALEITGGHQVVFEREIILAASLPYIYVNMRVVYPRTPNEGFNPAKAERLQQGWDESWQEVMPLQIFPALSGNSENSLKVWKHNYCDHISTFELDYGRFSANKALDSVNNQITHAWLAISNGDKGLLVAQNGDVCSNVAFCPLRTRRFENQLKVYMNPFGSYSGRQYHYATATTNLGNLLASTFSGADHLKPLAPSYNGRVQEFSLMIAAYHGEKPPESLQYDAEAYAYPYIVLNDDILITNPPHRAWDGCGLGE